MNKIEKLIEEFCPQGVEFRALGEVCEIKTGQAVNKIEIAEKSGEFPVINSGREPLGFINKYNTEDDPLGVTTRGAGVGSITWCEGRYFRGTLNYSVTIKNTNKLISRFLFHILLQNQNSIQLLATYQGIPALNKSSLEKLKIPIPPLTIQKEIVKILDNFTQLEAELEAELEARKKQYEHYREELLSFGDDVEFKALGELGNLYGGLTGKSKYDFSNGNAKFITYMNIYSNIVINTDIDIFVKVGKDEKQNRIEYGDVLFTGSSETPDECGMSSVLTKKTDEQLYLNSFCFGFRFHDINLLLPEFSKYLFRDEQVRKQIAETASGVTRFNISKKRFAKIQIPIPPLTIQKEIVRILDNFTQLEAELEAELEARKKQYEHYREELLSFGDDMEFRALGEVCDVTSGGTPSKSKMEFWTGGTIPWLKSESCNNESVYQANHFITDLGLLKSSAKLINKNATLMALVGATIFKTAYLEFDSTTNQNIASVKSKDNFIIENKFIFYYLTNLYGELKNEMKNYGMLNLTTLRKFQIPIPPLPKQKEIVAILDKFDALVNDMSTGLPAEIAARKKQYEYYRNQLLTFKPLEAIEKLIEEFCPQGVEFRPLGEVCFKTENIKWKENPKIEYQYIDLSSVSRENNKIIETQTINSTNAPSRAQQIVKQDDVIFGTTRPTLKRYSLINLKHHNQICSTGFCVLRANQKVILPKYLFFILKSNNFYNFVENNQEGAGYPSISNSKVRNFQIPIPPLSKQKEIVTTLDKFDALVNDISTGLPAEIAARKKQYEYYCNQLLTFKPLEAQDAN